MDRLSKSVRDKELALHNSHKKRQFKRAGGHTPYGLNEKQTAEACVKKKTFASQKAASRHVELHLEITESLSHLDKLMVYKCHICEGWHMSKGLGNPKNFQVVGTPVFRVLHSEIAALLLKVETFQVVGVDAAATLQGYEELLVTYAALLNARSTRLCSMRKALKYVQTTLAEVRRQRAE